MALNRSPSQAAIDVLAAPLEVYRGWLLEVGCEGDGCSVGRSHRVTRLLGITPAPLWARCCCGFGRGMWARANGGGAGGSLALLDSVSDGGQATTPKGTLGQLRFVRFRS